MTELIISNNNTDNKIIANLAHTIWREHYIAIIGVDQVEYMLKKFQSEEAIATQIAEGYQYYLIRYEDTFVGYLSIIKKENSLFLSKIYVLSSYRGNKIGKSALEFVETKALELGCESVTLTVNKNNTNSIKAYEKIGFINLGPIVIDIGNGFVMDDFKMQKMIAR